MEWAEIRDEVVRRYSVVVDRGDEVAFVDPEGDGARRLVIRRREAGGFAWLHILAGIRRAGDVRFEDALRLNAQLPFGALALDGDQLVFCQSLCLPAVEKETLHRVVRVVALQAAEMRTRVGLQRAEHPYADSFSS
jgi:hypothetical protein